MNRGAALVSGAQTQIDFDIAELEYRAYLGPGLQAPPRSGAHAGQQFTDAERLGQIVVRACVQRLDFVLLVDASRQHDDGHFRPAAKVVQKLDAVAVRQSQIKNDEI